MGLFDFFKSRKERQKNAATLSNDSIGMHDDETNRKASKRNKIPNTKELLEKLKEIAKDTTEYQISYGAMCYSPAASMHMYKSCKCSSCKRKIGKFKIEDYSDIVKQSGLVKKTGLAQVKIVCIDCLIKMCKSGDYSYNITDWDTYESMACKYKNVTGHNVFDLDGLTLLEWLGEYQKSLRERKDSTDDEGLDELEKYIEPDYVVFLFKAADSSKQRLTVTSPYYFTYFLNFIQNKRTWKSRRDSTILLRDNINIIERLTGLKL